MMFRFLILGFLICGAFPVSAETVVPESITDEALWDVASSPYIIAAHTIIEEGAGVTVMPGVEVVFATSTLEVLGYFSVQGNEGLPAVLRLAPSGGGASYGPPISSFGGKIDIKHAVIEGVGGILGFDGAEIIVSDSRFTGSGRRGIGIYGASAWVHDSTFEYLRGNALAMYKSDHGDSFLSMARNTIHASSSFYGLYVEDGQYAEAKNNFWGHESGPKHAWYHSDGSIISMFNGQGARIYGNADIFPFLTHDPKACCSSVLFLPGLKASRLYLDEEGNENRLWEPNRDRDLEMLEMNDDVESIHDVYTKPGDVIGESPFENFGLNIYKSFMEDMDMLASDGHIADWEPVSYDWRYSPDELLANEGEHSIVSALARLASTSLTGRVTIVAHSNGGIVAKRLMQKLETENDAGMVDKVVFAAVPQFGTPQAIGSLLHGFNEGIRFLVSDQASRELGLTIPSAYNLLPSDKYLAWDSRPLVVVHPTSTLPSLVKMRAAFGLTINSTAGLHGLLLGSEGRPKAKDSDLASPSILDTDLLARAENLHRDIDLWTPPLGIELIQIAGWGRDTVSGIEYREGRRNGKPVLKHKPILVPDGDGTVVMGSAWALPASLNVERYEVNLQEAGRGLIKDRYHAGILEVSEVRELMQGIILRDPTRIPSIGILRKSTDPVVHEPEPRKKVFLYSPDHTIIFEGDADADDVDHRTFGDVSYVSVPDSGASSVPITIEYNTETPYAEHADEPPSISLDIDDVSFTDIPVATTSVAIIDFGTDASSTPNIDIDDDGDGEVDRTIEPDPVPTPDPVIVPQTAIVAAAETDAGSSSQGRSGGRRRIATTTEIMIFIDEPQSAPPSPQPSLLPLPQPVTSVVPLQESVPVPISAEGMSSMASAYAAIRYLFERLLSLILS